MVPVEGLYDQVPWTASGSTAPSGQITKAAVAVPGELSCSFDGTFRCIEERAKAGSPASETLRAAADTGRSAAEATRPMLAKKGRAAYTGERSVGTLDAGAVAVAVLLEALSEQYPADA